MKFNKLLIAAALLAVLGGLVYWSNKDEAAKLSKPAPASSPRVLEIPEDQVRRIEITRRDGETTALDRSAHGWEIVAPKKVPVDSQTVAAIVSAVTLLPSEQVVVEKPSNLGQFGLAMPALTVKVDRKDGKSVKLLIGDEAPAESVTYAKTDSDPRVFAISNATKSALDKSWGDLRERRLLTFDPEKLARVELSSGGQTLEFGRNASNSWAILKPKPVRADSLAVEDLVSKLKDARMESSPTDAEEAELAKAFNAAAPVATAKATDATGTQQLEIRKAKDDTYYARSSAVPGVYLFSTDAGKAFSKTLDDFRNKKVFDFGFSDPARVEVQQDGKSWNFDNVNHSWMSNGRAQDAGAVQQLIDLLRNLTATKFVDRASGTPVGSYFIALTGNKGSEKVIITKSGANYIAQREGESGGYEIAPSVVEEIHTAAAAVRPAPPPRREEKKK